MQRVYACLVLYVWMHYGPVVPIVLSLCQSPFSTHKCTHCTHPHNICFIACLPHKRNNIYVWYCSRHALRLPIIHKICVHLGQIITRLLAMYYISLPSSRAYCLLWGEFSQWTFKSPCITTKDLKESASGGRKRVCCLWIHFPFVC